MRTQSEKSMHGYVPVNGLEMYYETYGGAGQPLVLLHGAFSAIGASFGKILPALATPALAGGARETRQVIAFELQAHG
ncbi:MAG: alpha/beta fold hydrolase, partial [Anaerolineales bacterium]